MTDILGRWGRGRTPWMSRRPADSPRRIAGRFPRSARCSLSLSHQRGLTRCPAFGGAITTHRLRETTPRKDRCPSSRSDAAIGAIGAAGPSSIYKSRYSAFAENRICTPPDDRKADGLIVNRIGNRRLRIGDLFSCCRLGLPRESSHRRDLQFLRRGTRCSFCGSIPA